jgi:CPA1 family monovalent cation:H+ antiporter
VTILNGESVVNDPVSLVAYRLAVAAVVYGTFSLAQAALQLVLAVIGGIAAGLAVALLADRVQHRLHNPPAEVTLTLLVPYVAFIVADRLATSGVLAVAAAGIALGWHDPEARSTESRLLEYDFWAVFVFVLNGLIFILLGLELRSILTGVANRPAQMLAWAAGLIIATVVLVRIIWMFVSIFLPLMISCDQRAQRPYPLWKGALIAGWAGMRGADTLVVALALPNTTARGAPFPDRAFIMFLTFCVIAATLLVQGLSLPPLIVRLGLPADDTIEREVAKARVAAARAALARLDELEQEERAPKEAAEYVRRRARRRVEHFGARAKGTSNRTAEEDAAAVQDMLRELVDAEQRAIVELRNQGDIGDEALREVLRDLDLEEQRLE